MAGFPSPTVGLYWMRISIGFLLAPLAFPGLILIFIPVNPSDLSPLYQFFHQAVVWGSMRVAYPAVLLIGVPAFILFHRNNWLTFPHILFAGIAVGAVAPALSSALFNERVFFDPYSVIHGLIGATAFWFIAAPDAMQSGRNGRNRYG